MTTITLEKSPKLSKTSYMDIEELFNDYRKVCIAEGDYIQLVELSDDQVTEEMKEQVSAVKNLSRSAFINI